MIFTADPLTGERDRIVLNAARGLGEVLVSGRTTVDEYVIQKDGGRLLHRRCAGNVPALPEAEALPALALLSLAIERHSLAPQDVEWAWADGRAFLLQSRPITNLKQEPVPIAQAERPILGYLDRWREMFPSAGTPLLNDIAINVIVTKVAQNAAFHGFLPASQPASRAPRQRLGARRRYALLRGPRHPVPALVRRAGGRLEQAHGRPHRARGSRVHEGALGPCRSGTCHGDGRRGPRARRRGALAALADVPEARPWLDAWEHFLDRFGHRAIEEVEL